MTETTCPLCGHPADEAAMIRKFIEEQSAIYIAAYERSMSYTALIMFGGYAGLFTVWQFTGDRLGRWETLLSAFLMLFSIATFILFEIYKTYRLSNDLVDYQTVLNNQNQSSLTKLMQANHDFRLRVLTRTQGVNRIWKYAFHLTVWPGILAAGILGFAFISGLVAAASKP